MTGPAREGVIKFQLDFQPGEPPPAGYLSELNAWRTIFCRLGLLGQDANRYHGLGFGNLSRRLPDQGEHAFVISGTQTGHLPNLQPEHYAIVLQCAPIANRLMARGRSKPSSEALSHAVLYQVKAQIQWVMHLHSPDIFNARGPLGLPCTNPSAAYGTPEMAMEIERLATRVDQQLPGLLVMTGHQDGILAYGESAPETGELVVETLALALRQNR
ncbi:MAG: class II aldolase/adducin family protein [Desulfuromonadales bacterium]